MGLSPYEKKSYKESKRRRKQALLADETGYIKPYRNRKKRLTVIIFAIGAILLIAGGVFLWHTTQSPKTDETSHENKINEEELLTVVNTQHPLKSDYVPELENFHGFQINPLAADSARALFDEAEKRGIELKLKSAYVSYFEQQELYENVLSQLLANPEYTEVRAEAAARKLVPAAGCSESQTGLLLDFELSDSSAADFLERNSVNFGFILRYPENKEDFTHALPSDSAYRYVGAENAIKLRSYNMCLEEYIEYLQSDN